MIYNLDYYENMLRMYSKSAEQISKIRWDFISEVNPSRVLDYGCGCGWFRAYRPDYIVVDTYDIGGYPQTGIILEKYDVVCFWDVLEHLDNFSEIEEILCNTNYVAITVPIKPSNIKLEEWKHFKPGEHLHYFNKKMLDVFFKKYGFKRIKEGQPECPPRQDINSFLYKKEVNDESKRKGSNHQRKKRKKIL